MSQKYNDRLKMVAEEMARAKYNITERAWKSWSDKLRGVYIKEVQPLAAIAVRMQGEAVRDALRSISALPNASIDIYLLTEGYCPINDEG
jgi:hypothetical protein